MAGDHLLVVSSTGYADEYRRIQFANIRGFFTLDSNRRHSWFVFWLFVSLLAGTIAVTNQLMGRQPAVSLVFLGIGALGILWNHLLGPSCKVYVVTGVQTLLLPSVVRRAKARKVFARIEPLIVESQRHLSLAPPPAPAWVEPPPLP